MFKWIALTPLVLSQVLLPTFSSQASPPPRSGMEQITSVQQLSDVKPTEWAFEALRSLVERYGCIIGYSDNTFRGDRAVTRWEFAAGLNACLNTVERLFQENVAVLQEDIDKLKRLAKDFQVELAALGARVDNLEQRVSFLEDHQFSTTTKLNAEVIIGFNSILGGDAADGTPAPQVPVLGNRVRLNFDTSFAGNDRLRVRLQANNIPPYNEILGTFQGRLNYDGNSNNSVRASLIQYRFPIASQTTAYIGVVGNGFVDFDFTGPLNPFFEGGFSISDYGLRNPIYTYAGGAGGAIRHDFNKTFSLNVGYLTNNAQNPSPDNGLFNGRYIALGQLLISPTDNFKFGFIYANSYSPASQRFGPNTGSIFANSNFGYAVSTNSYGFGLTYGITPNINFNGSVVYVNQRYIGAGDGDVWSWTTGLAFTDVGREGSVLGVLVGMEPHLTSISSNINQGQTDEDPSLTFNLFYRYALSNNINITPGIMWITNPNFDANNSDLFIGVIRTIFTF